jgi:hypothetical protein
MRIQVPLSPLDCENGNPQYQPESNDLNRGSTKKQNPLLRVKQVNAQDSSPHIRSYCLERTPLSDIDNLPAELSDRETSPGSSPSQGGLAVGLPDEVDMPEFRIREEESSTPTLITGSARKKNNKKASFVDVTQQAKIDALEAELAELKDFVVDMDRQRRSAERLLEEERESREIMKKEFTLKEGALQNRICTLRSMLKMVSLEKDRLISFQQLEEQQKIQV